jgi:indole-3-glycerol phosphate synthase
MHNVLQEIVKYKKQEVELKKMVLPLEELKRKPALTSERLDFYKAISKGSVNIIAEIKQASPSQGQITANFDPASIAAKYSSNGARAISVLTEEKYFKGRIEYLECVKINSGLPVLRKDFILEEYQVYESMVFGADAILLIAALLEAQALKKMVKLAYGIGLDVIVEVHTKEELSSALESGSRIIGINNRDLHTFSVDKNTSLILAPLIPKDRLIVVESGIAGRKDIEMYLESGIKAFLIGEYLMKSNNIEFTLKELVGNE